MTRINVVLLLVLMASGIYLVGTAYDARRLFTALDRAQAEERVLDTELQRLKAERQAQATPLRVEKTARERLAMRSATPAITQYVTWSAAASGVQK
jgi:cell division protein FtsL